MSERSYGIGAAEGAPEPGTAVAPYTVTIERLDQAPTPIPGLTAEEAADLCAYAQAGEFPCINKCAIRAINERVKRFRTCPIDPESLDQLLEG